MIHEVFIDSNEKEVDLTFYDKLSSKVYAHLMLKVVRDHHIRLEILVEDKFTNKSFALEEELPYSSELAYTTKQFADINTVLSRVTTDRIEVLGVLNMLQLYYDIMMDLVSEKARQNLIEETDDET